MSRGRKRKGYKAAQTGYFADLARRAHEATPADDQGRKDLGDFQRNLRELGKGFSHAEIARFADVCRECGLPGHWAKDCPDVFCGNCWTRGHHRRDCPQAAS